MKKIIWIPVIIILMVLAYKYRYIIGIAIAIYYVIKDTKKEKPKQIESKKTLEVIDTQAHDRYRMQTVIAEEKINEAKEVMKNTDVRQFEGRNDVTIEEVAKYMIAFSQYIGIEKRKYQMDRICQVCNLTKDDMNEVNHLIWGKTKILEDKEGQKINEYYIRKEQEEYENKFGKSYWRELKENELKKCRNEIEKKEIEKVLSEEKIKEKEEKEYALREDYEYKINYEGWLKKKGYIQ